MKTTWFWSVFCVLLLAGCSDQGEEKIEYVAFGEYENPEDSLPRLVFFEGNQVSLNDRCAVRKVRLNPNMPAAYVNGHPIGFC